MSTNIELAHIKELAKKANATSVLDIMEVMDSYVKTVTWSLVKEEWNVSMTYQEREQFARKLLGEINP